MTKNRVRAQTVLSGLQSTIFLHFVIVIFYEISSQSQPIQAWKLYDNTMWRPILHLCRLVLLFSYSWRPFPSAYKTLVRSNGFLRHSRTTFTCHLAPSQARISRKNKRVDCTRRNKWYQMSRWWPQRLCKWLNIESWSLQINQTKIAAKQKFRHHRIWLAKPCQMILLAKNTLRAEPKANDNLNPVR